MARSDPYPVCETWTATVTEASNAAARLVEAVQRCDITREDIAHTVVRLEPQFRQIAEEFLSPHTGRQTVHKCVEAAGEIIGAGVGRSCLVTVS